MNKLQKTSLEWSLINIINEGDTDLFPEPFEIKLIQKAYATIVDKLVDYDITNHQWQGFRKILIPKDEITFRSFCQLDPLDTILFTAILFEIGKRIEQKRIPIAENRVFSYRFNPSPRGRLFGEKNLWGNYWKISKVNSQKRKYIVVTDITDFYNQIYHHTIENTLQQCSIDKFYITPILNLLKNYTGAPSRGIPIGPYPSHLLAELSLIPIDENLKIKGYDFCRYVDDIHIFCNSEEDCQIAIYDLASALDTVKLNLNRHRTKVLTKEKFLELSNLMLEDNPINEIEASIIKIITTKSSDPYLPIELSNLTASELKLFSKENIEEIFEAYFKTTTPNYIRLRWFLRRISQVRIAAGIDFIINNFSKFIPAIADAVHYINLSSSNYSEDWDVIGKQLLSILETPIIKRNEYLQAVLLHLFTRIKDLNNIDFLIKNFSNFGDFAKRKVILTAIQANASSWLREFKDKYSSFDPWLRRAVIFAATTFPEDERRHWLSQVRKTSGDLENIIINTIF